MTKKIIKRSEKDDVNIEEQGSGWRLIRTGEVTGDVICDSWNGFLDFFHHENALRENNNYVFRGHASENWKLESTLKRVLGDGDKKETEILEEQSLGAFKKYSLGKRGHNPT